MASKHICKYLIENAPIMRSEVCKALKVTKNLVGGNVADFARANEYAPVKIISEVVEKDIRYTIKPSEFALAQQFIRSRKYGTKAKSKTANPRVSTAATA